MVAELTKAFQEPPTTTKVTDAASVYKVQAELYTSLFKSPKVEEEKVKQVGNIRPLAINFDFHRALESSIESSMATRRLGWHMTVLINYLYNHCQGDPVLKALCNHLHGAIQESLQTSAQAASVAIAAERRMILNASAFQDCRPLKATLLSTPFVGSSLFGGQFQSSFEEATHSQEKLTQVRQLASAGSRAAEGTSASRAPPQHQKRRAVLPPPPPPTTQSVPSGDGCLAAKRRRSKNWGNKQKMVWWGPCSGSGSAGRLELHRKVSSLRAADYHFPPSLPTNNLGQVCPGGYQTGVLPPFCEASPFVFVSYGDTVAQAAVQTTSAVRRGFIPPIQGGCGDCRSVSGPGGILFPLFPGYQVQWWVPPHPQPTWPQLAYSSCQVPHGDPHLHSSGSSQRLGDGVAGSQGRLSACANTPQLLAVPSVCSQEPDRGAHSLPMEGSSFWLSHCPQSFYQTPGSVSSSPAFAGLSDVPVHQ